ncbi:sulfite exporter TauE/SafE family protein [Trinickia caryophylli]|nr:sulfite exporter TauE/SafE family protein [Trinickia caryophylli]
MRAYSGSTNWPSRSRSPTKAAPPLALRGTSMTLLLSWLHEQLALAGMCGLSIGFTLGLVGGGAGMLAVPLLLYVVKVGDVHVAIGTTAVSIALTAIVNLVRYARAGLVHWRFGATFAATGVTGAFVGSMWSLHVDAAAVMLLLAALVAMVGVTMFSRRQPAADAVELAAAPVRGLATAGAGVAVGGLSGFFGVSGGFLSVPALHLIARIPMLQAVASSLVSVVAFSTTTGLNYARAGKVSVPLALALVAGGLLGSAAGMRAAKSLSGRGPALRRLFALMLIAISAYIAYRSTVRT